MLKSLTLGLLLTFAASLPLGQPQAPSDPIQIIPAPSPAPDGPFCPGPIRLSEPPAQPILVSVAKAFSRAQQPEATAQPAAARPSVLAGRITGPDGRPVPGVTVQLYSGVATRFAGQSAVTDADGRYRFDPLQTGGGWTDRLVPGVQISHPSLVSADGKDWWDITVPFGQSVTQDFTLIQGGRIAGTLTFGAGHWTLRDFDLRFACADQRTAYARTASNGSFTSPCLFPGEYDVSWNSPYPTSGFITRIKVEAGKTTEFTANCTFDFKAEVSERAPRANGG